MKEQELTKKRDVMSAPTLGGHDVIDLSTANTVVQLGDSLTRSINRTVDPDHNVLITGLPGSGKTLIGRSLKKNVVSIDRFGSLQHGKWIIDVKKLSTQFDGPSRSNVFIGTCDNMLDVLRTLKPVVVLVLSPSHSYFSAVMDTRAKEETHFVDEWVKRVSWTQSDIDNQVDKTIDDLRNMMVPVIKKIILPDMSSLVPVTARGEQQSDSMFSTKTKNEQPVAPTADVPVQEFNTALLVHDLRLKGAEQVWASDVASALILVDGYTYEQLFASDQLADVIKMCGKHSRVSIHAVVGTFNNVDWDWRAMIASDEFSDEWMFIDEEKYIVVSGAIHYDNMKWLEEYELSNNKNKEQ